MIPISLLARDLQECFMDELGSLKKVIQDGSESITKSKKIITDLDSRLKSRGGDTQPLETPPEQIQGENTTEPPKEVAVLPEC